MTGIILAGGCNSRIPVSKAFIYLSEISIIEHTIQILQNEFDEIIIVAKNRKKYEHLGPKIICDIYENMGPLAGIHAGLMASKSQYNFFTACDMPFLTNNIIQYLKSYIYNVDAIVPEHDGFLEPLCAIYSKNCISPIEKNLKMNFKSIRSFFPEVNFKSVNWKNGPKINNNPIVFFNINTPENLKQAQNFIQQQENHKYD